jgi:hypothetical protein
MKSKKFKKVLGIIVICILVLFLSKDFISRQLFNAMCGDEVVQKIPLSNGYKLKLHQVDCGATTGFSYNLTIAKDNKNSKEIMNFEMLNDDPGIEADLSNNKLTITYSQPTVVFNKENTYSNLDIHFNREGKDFKVPSSFKEQRKYSDVDYVSLYSNELEIYQNEEIPAAQVEFAVNKKGKLKSNWNEHWLVIGHINDEVPIFIDDSKQSSPIYVGGKNNSQWERVQIATSFRELQSINKKIDNISDNHFTPEDLEENPLKESDINKILKTIKGNQNNIKFWDNILRGVELNKNL